MASEAAKDSKDEERSAAMAALLREADRGSRRYESMGPSGWAAPGCGRPDRRFLYGILRQGVMQRTREQLEREAARDVIRRDRSAQRDVTAPRRGSEGDRKPPREEKRKPKGRSDADRRSPEPKRRPHSSTERRRQR